MGWDFLIWIAVFVVVGLLIVAGLRVLYLKWEDRQIQKEDAAWLHDQVQLGKIDRIELNEQGLAVLGTLNKQGTAYLDNGAQWVMPLEVNNTMNEVFEESNLVKHARHELKILGEDQDTIDWFARVIGEYSSFGHSGGSHMAILPMLHDLLNFRNLLPLTDDPDEWMWHGDEIAGPGGIWQNKRCGSSFSNDGGKTYWDLDRGGKDVIYYSRPHQEPWPDDHYWHDRTGRYYQNGKLPIPRDAKGRFMKAEKIQGS